MGNKSNRKKKISKLKIRMKRKAVCAAVPRTRGLFTTKQDTMTQQLDILPSTSAGITSDGIALKSVDQEFSTVLMSAAANFTKVSQNKPDTSTSKFQVTDPLIAQQTEDNNDSYVIEIEKNKEEFQPVSGRRIIDINHLLNELQNKACHNELFECGMSNFRLISEKRQGLISFFKFECNMCKHVCIIKSENTDNNEKVNLNIAATSGIVASGIGYSQFEELCSAMDIPVFSPRFYSKLQEEVFEKWENTACSSMKAAAEKEKEIAFAEGRIKNGFPVIDVYVDGSWCARSYGSNYKALSGTAAIIGRKTRQVLYIGVKNKYCLVCARAENKNVTPKEHKCFKNYEGSSCSMENEIIVEGFKSSLSTYGLIYGRMIGDGDASTYAKILQARPYAAQNITVEKIECRNHILRNFCKRLRNLTTETKYLLAQRKTLTNVKIMTMRKAIVNSIRHQKVSECPRNVAISVLHNDIINSVAHAYGDHRLCQEYYCTKEKNDNRELTQIQNSTFTFRINAIVGNVASKSRSLIEDVDTNTVECFNSVIAKFIGGKRTNFALKGGYQSRCSAAVVSFNTKSALSTVQAAFIGKNPGGNVEIIERKRAIKRKHNSEQPGKKRRILKEVNKKQNDYGPASSAPDMSSQELEKAKDEFMNNLEQLTSDKDAIERATILQRDSSEWLEIRKNLITASNFGPICKRKVTLGTAPLVKNILYRKNLANVASIAHGVEHERQALLQLEKQESITIVSCGLFIDKTFPFIGATPDGLVGDDVIVEIKCPITASKTGLSRAIQENKIQILKYDKKTCQILINKKSNWYYQIQGQLHVTGRRLCLLGIWAGENEPLFTKQIERDDGFWKTKMETKLVLFYKKCLLPEIVDSRHARGMPIRNLTLESKQAESTNLPDKENVYLV